MIKCKVNVVPFGFNKSIGIEISMSYGDFKDEDSFKTVFEWSENPNEFAKLLEHSLSELIQKLK